MELLIIVDLWPHHFNKSVEEIDSIVWAWSMLRVVLNGKGLVPLVAHTFHTAIVKVDVGDFDLLAVKAFGINTKTMVL